MNTSVAYTILVFLSFLGILFMAIIPPVGWVIGMIVLLFITLGGDA